MINNVTRIFNNKYFWIILIILICGFFLRTYHFSDWLHFELDQSRDARVIDLAMDEGPSNLPLLGPKAAGSFLRLGPIFYYFKYLSALIFGNTPSGIAVITMLFGILAMPVFYFFIREYFDKKISISLLLIFSLSLFLIVYSRFSWNPNPLPLFTILTFWALLKLVNSKNKFSGWWLAIVAISMVVTTQMHFLAFISAPIIFVLFLIIKRPKIKFKFWLLSAFLIFFLYLPPIINDLKTGGDNIRQLFKVAEKKSSASDHTLIEKKIKAYTENSLGYLLILSGYSKAELPKFNQMGKIWSWDIVCDKNCKNNLPAGIIALILYSSGIILLLLNAWKEKETKRKNFLLINSLWFLVTFVFFIPIAFDISPRFFLLISVLPFIFLGLIWEFIEKKIPKLGILIVSVLISILAISNILAIKNRFAELKNAPYKTFDLPADRILKEKNRVTLEQQYLINDYMISFYRENNFPIYLNSESYYRRSFLYHLEKMQIPHDDFRNSTNTHTIYQNGNYFLIYPTLSNLESRTEKYLKDFNIVSRKDFGTLTVIRLSPKKESTNAIQQEFEPKGKPKSAPGVPVRFRWEEIFSSNNSEDDSEN